MCFPKDFVQVNKIWKLFLMCSHIITFLLSYQIKNYTNVFVFVRLDSHIFACVRLHITDISWSSITKNPKIDPIYCWFWWFILSEWLFDCCILRSIVAMHLGISYSQTFWYEFLLLLPWSNLPFSVFNVAHIWTRCLLFFFGLLWFHYWKIIAYNG